MGRPSGFRTRFQQSALGTVSSVLDAASSFFGGVLGRAADLGERARSATWEKAHDEAFTNAMEELKPDFAQCRDVPREDADMSLLHRTTLTTYCPHKGDAAYFSIDAGGKLSNNAVWTYERPYAGVAAIAGYLAFYPERVDAIEERDIRRSPCRPPVAPVGGSALGMLSRPRAHPNRSVSSNQSKIRSCPPPAPT